MIFFLIVVAGISFYIAIKLYKEKHNRKENAEEKNSDYSNLSINNYSVEENYYHRDGYLRLMKKYENINGEVCNKVAWRDYDFEAYRHMTKEKRNWYLYWRTQVRKGVFLDTDFAYIHCYITEIINGIGGYSTREIFSTLEKVYFRYSETYEDLNWIIPELLFDISILNNHPFSDITIGNLKQFSNYYCFKKNCIIDRFVKDKENVIPLEILNILSNNYIKNSSFYKKCFDIFNEIIPEIVRKICMEKPNGKYLFSCVEKRVSSKNMKPFEKIYYCHQVSDFNFSVKDYINSDNLKNTVTGIIKFTVSILNKFYNQSSTTHNIDLDGETKEFIISVLEKEYNIVLPEVDTIEIERAKLSASLRYDILKRDGFKCQICGATIKDGVKLHVDHIFPVSKGGKTEPNNLRTLCDKCNLGKSDKIEE